MSFKNNQVESLLTEFLNYNPDYIENLGIFDDSIKQKLHKKLKKEKDKQNFRSIVSEIQFGKLLKTINLNIEYDKKHQEKLTPDWTVYDNECIALIEVYRLGKSKDSQKRSDFEQKILMAIRKIEKPYIIKLTFINSKFNPDNYDLNKIIEELENWILSFNDKEHKITVQNLVELKVYSKNSNYKYINLIGNASSIDFKPEKLEQSPNLSPNEITKKLTKYQSLIEETKAPYFLAISIDFTSGFEIDDFINYFRGTYIHNADFGIDIQNYPECKICGQNWTRLGMFYQTKHLSGLILSYNNVYKLILNPVKNQVIYEEKNKSLLDKLYLINSLDK